jgi:hypothetical protein
MKIADGLRLWRAQSIGRNMCVLLDSALNFGKRGNAPTEGLALDGIEGLAADASPNVLRNWPKAAKPIRHVFNNSAALLYRRPIPVFSAA